MDEKSESFSLVSLVTTHFADGILQHRVLLVEVVYSLFALSVDSALAAGRSSGSAGCRNSKHGLQGRSADRVRQQWSSEDRVAAEEVDLDLHWVTHPAEDVDVALTLLLSLRGG